MSEMDPAMLDTAGRLARRMGARFVPHDESVPAKPSYLPPQKLSGWISPDDMKAEIVKLAENGADKAVCWDMLQAVYRLAGKQVSLSDGDK